jgi:hypothetical protein
MWKAKSKNLGFLPEGISCKMIKTLHISTETEVSGRRGLWVTEDSWEIVSWAELSTVTPGEKVKFRILEDKVKEV